MVFRRKKHPMNQKGFTLIEVIASLILVAILAVMVGFFFVQITKSYILTKQNAEAVQKAQIAITRIVKELSASTSLSSPTAASVTYTRPTAVTNTISIANGLVQISGTTNGTITDNVVTASSSFAYFDAAGNTTANPASIKRIDVTLTVAGVGNPFTNSVWINESY
jgi:prepilin-type N-terminal cleavage/methylation domain-containing protein